MVVGDAEGLEVLERAIRRVHVVILSDVVSVVPQRRRIEGKQPDGVDSEAAQVVEPGREAWEVSDAIIVGIRKGPHVDLIDDRILVPERGAENT